MYLVSLEGMSYREAGKILGKSEQQVTNLVHRGKKSLKKILENRRVLYMRTNEERQQLIHRRTLEIQREQQ